MQANRSAHSTGGILCTVSKRGLPRFCFYFFKHFGFGEILIYSEPQEQIRQLRSAVLVLWGVEGSGTKAMRGLLKLISGFGKGDSLECAPQEIGGGRGFCGPVSSPGTSFLRWLSRGARVLSGEDCVCLGGGVAEDSGHLTAAPSWDFPMAPITKQKAT